MFNYMVLNSLIVVKLIQNLQDQIYNMQQVEILHQIVILLDHLSIVVVDIYCKLFNQKISIFRKMYSLMDRKHQFKLLILIMLNSNIIPLYWFKRELFQLIQQLLVHIIGQYLVHLDIQLVARLLKILYWLQIMLVLVQLILDSIL